MTQGRIQDKFSPHVKAPIPLDAGTFAQHVQSKSTSGYGSSQGGTSRSPVSPDTPDADLLELELELELDPAPTLAPKADDEGIVSITTGADTKTFETTTSKPPPPKHAHIRGKRTKNKKDGENNNKVKKKERGKRSIDHETTTGGSATGNSYRKRTEPTPPARTRKSEGTSKEKAKEKETGKVKGKGKTKSSGKNEAVTGKVPKRKTKQSKKSKAFQEQEGKTGDEYVD